MRTFNSFELKRLNFNIPLQLYKRVKEFSDSRGLPVTQGIVLLLNKSLDNETLIDNLPDLLKSIVELKSNEISNQKN